jgi:hypothetical protein
MATLIRYKSGGSVRRVADFVARRLIGRGLAEPADAPAAVEAPEAPEPPLEIPVADEGDGLDSLDAEALHALAKERGIAVHHRSGADRVRAALRGGE